MEPAPMVENADAEVRMVWKGNGNCGTQTGLKQHLRVCHTRTKTPRLSPRKRGKSNVFFTENIPKEVNQKSEDVAPPTPQPLKEE